MAPISLIPEEALFATAELEPTLDADECTKVTKASLQRASVAPALGDIVEEEATDAGQGSASETESSCLSSDEGRTMGKRCRFGKTPLETIPATPVGVVTSLLSPPGFSRAAMRQARDACKSDTDPSKAAVVSTARFGESQFGTVPKTPSGGAKLKALAAKVGSPPGLSRAEMRRARDLCKGAATPAWGSQAESRPAVSKQCTARDKVNKMKEDAALLGQMKKPAMLAAEKEVSDEDPSEEEPIDQACEDSPEDDSTCSSSETQANDGQRCRFGGSALGTIPSTPVGGEAPRPSPLGSSRKAMLRQARDACNTAGSAVSSWGVIGGALLTITPDKASKMGFPGAHGANSMPRDAAAATQAPR